MESEDTQLFSLSSGKQEWEETSVDIFDVYAAIHLPMFSFICAYKACEHRYMCIIIFDVKLSSFACMLPVYYYLDRSV